MARISYVNGRFVDHRKAFVHIEDRGYQFSDGIYEYIAFYNRKLLDADLHVKRLERSLKELQIAMPVTRAQMHAIMNKLIARNANEDGGLYIQISRGVAPRDHAFPKDVKPSLIMTISKSKLPKSEESNGGVKVITVPDIRWGRRDIKSISLLANVLAKQEAAKRQVREAWLIENGVITEGSASNAYIITKSGQLVTHPCDEHILGGITRNVVLKLARKAGIAVVERAFTVKEIKAAAEAFMTSTSANILPVVQIDGKKVGSGKTGAITRTLQALYAAHIFKQTGKKL